MAKPDTPPGQEKQFTATHPTDPTSPRQVTNQEWSDEKLGQKGWTKGEPVSDDVVVNPLNPNPPTK